MHPPVAHARRCAYWLGRYPYSLGVEMYVFVSYPKSGRTWLRVILAEIGVAAEFTHLDAGVRKTEWGKRYDQLDLPKVEGRLVFLHRDPRDTVVSFFHEMTKRQQPPLARRLRFAVQGKLPPKNLADFVRSPRFGIEKIIRFNIACRENLNTHVVSYEELRANPVDELAKIFPMIQKSDIRKAVHNNTFEKMQKREGSGYYKTNKLRPSNPEEPDSFKVRRGKVGGWRDEMDKETQEYSNRVIEEYQYFRRIADI